ncbi:MAG: hypothetical protein IPN68_17485 [Bacteroidetes bacterium]|nr:hypothetical protein [Bacteroidota bacterium]
MMKNEVYAGWIKKFGERHIGLFKPIVTEELFKRVQYVINRRKHRGFEYQWENPDFPLRRFVHHPSGQRLTGSWSKGRSKKYAYYRYSSLHCEISKTQLEDGYKLFLECFEFDEKHYSKFKTQVKENLLKKSEEKINEAKRLTAYIEERKSKQGVILQKNIEGLISNEVLRQQSVLIEKQISDTQLALQEIPNSQADLKDAIEFASEYLRHPSQVWEKAPYSIQWQLQWFQFPQGIFFDGQKIGTMELCDLFKAKQTFLPEKSPGVHFKTSTSNRNLKKSYVITNRVARSDKSELTPPSDPIYWHKVENELIKLSNIMKELKYGPQKEVVTYDNLPLFFPRLFRSSKRK